MSQPNEYWGAKLDRLSRELKSQIVEQRVAYLQQLRSIDTFLTAQKAALKSAGCNKAALSFERTMNDFGTFAENYSNKVKQNLDSVNALGEQARKYPYNDAIQQSYRSGMQSVGDASGYAAQYVDILFSGRLSFADAALYANCTEAADQEYRFVLNTGGSRYAARALAGIAHVRYRREEDARHRPATNGDGLKR